MLLPRSACASILQHLLVPHGKLCKVLSCREHLSVVLIFRTGASPEFALSNTVIQLMSIRKAASLIIYPPPTHHMRRNLVELNTSCAHYAHGVASIVLIPPPVFHIETSVEVRIRRLSTCHPSLVGERRARPHCWCKVQVQWSNDIDSRPLEQILTSDMHN